MNPLLLGGQRYRLRSQQQRHHGQENNGCPKEHFANPGHTQPPCSSATADVRIKPTPMLQKRGQGNAYRLSKGYKALLAKMLESTTRGCVFSRRAKAEKNAVLFPGLGGQVILQPHLLDLVELGFQEVNVLLLVLKEGDQQVAGAVVAGRHAGGDPLIQP